MKNQNYALSINLVQRLHAEDLLVKLKNKGVMSPDISRQLIRKKLAKDPDAEVSPTSLKVSLICPVSVFSSSGFVMRSVISAISRVIFFMKTKRFF